jgi:hypothetical protein
METPHLDVTSVECLLRARARAAIVVQKTAGRTVGPPKERRSPPSGRVTNTDTEFVCVYIHAIKVANGMFSLPFLDASYQPLIQPLPSSDQRPFTDTVCTTCHPPLSPFRPPPRYSPPVLTSMPLISPLPNLDLTQLSKASTPR